MTSPGTTAPPVGAHVQVKGGLARGGLADTDTDTDTDAVGARARPGVGRHPPDDETAHGGHARDIALLTALRDVAPIEPVPAWTSAAGVAHEAGEALAARRCRQPVARSV